jgi:hypothetical protein
MAGAFEVRRQGMTKIHDPDFGELIWKGALTGAWHGRLTLEVFGDVEIQLGAAREQSPSEAQCRALLSLSGRAEAVRGEIERALFDYYSRGRAGFARTSSPEETDELFPPLSGPADVWRLLSRPTIYVPPQTEADLMRLSFSGNCTWDEEHGVEVTLEDGAAVKTDIIGG